MNNEARQLGMTKTRFINPHGLTDKEHKSTASDMVLLTTAASKLALFQKVTGTAQYGCRVTGASGYVRNVKWEKHESVLGIEGYKA